MSSGDEANNTFTKKASAFLSNKPVWVWWVFYLAVTGVLFGIFSLAFYLLTVRWWVGVLILIATGTIWGSIKYSRMKGRIREEKKGEKIVA